jgi:hypothetical protein
MRFVVLGLVSCIAIACATPAALPQSSSENAPDAISRPISEVPQEFHRLSGDEIQALVADRWVSLERDFDRAVRRRNEEFFCTSGMWGGVGARFPLVGRYSTSDDELCVHYADGESFCRYVLTDASGRYFTQRIRGEPPTQSPIEVRIYTQDHEPHCT